MKYNTLQTLKTSLPLLLKKPKGIIFILLCLLVMGASCNRENTSPDESDGQVTTGSLGESTATDSTDPADTREETEGTDTEEDENTEEDESTAGEDTEDEQEESGTDFDWQDLGKTTYNSCQACHQVNGEGIPGAFPPLKGHMAELYNAEGGRKYIINVVIYGLQGEIEVQATTYSSAMSQHKFLSDEQIAAVLNHELSSWGNDELLEEFSPILPSEVTAERENDFSPQEVLELRPNLP